MVGVAGAAHRQRYGAIRRAGWVAADGSAVKFGVLIDYLLAPKPGRDADDLHRHPQTPVDSFMVGRRLCAWLDGFRAEFALPFNPGANQPWRRSEQPRLAATKSRRGGSMVSPPPAPC